MKKSSTHIERDLYSLLQASPLVAALRGQLYRAEMRPVGARSEDAVLHFLAGGNEQMQEGFLSLTLFVPKLPTAAQSLPDYERLEELQTLLLQWLEQHSPQEYELAADPLPTTLHEESADYSLIAARLRYRRYSD